MKSVLLLALLAMSQAVEVPNLLLTPPKLKPEQQLPEHIQTLITNHINQVLHHVQKQQQTTTTTPSSTLVGQVPTVVETNSGAQQQQVAHKQGQLPQVINHQAMAMLMPRGAEMNVPTTTLAPNVQNKVVPHVPHIVVSLPGQAPVDVGDKIKRLQEHVSQIMQQAQTHIPQAINHAIKERQRLEQQIKNKIATALGSSTTTKQPDHVEHAVPQPNAHVVPLKSARSLELPPHVTNVVQQVHQHVPQLINKRMELQQLGKCNFECPQKSLPVCGSSPRGCVVEFPGQCELSKWNCFNTNNVFTQVHDDDCKHKMKCRELDNMQWLNTNRRPALLV